MLKIDYSLYLVIDDFLCYPRSIIDVMQQVVDAGITCVQLRMKNSAIGDVLYIGRKLLAILKPNNIPLIINDHLEAAKLLDADGVHIGQTDIPYTQARNYLGADKIIGLSVTNYEQAGACGDWDVDYFGVGPVYPTSSKLDAAPPVGVDGLARILPLLKKPVVGIGGINQHNIQPVLQTGVAGIAVISAILAAPSPANAARTLAELIKTHKLSRQAYV